MRTITVARRGGMSTEFGYFDTMGPSSSQPALFYCFNVIDSVRPCVRFLVRISWSRLLVSIIAANDARHHRTFSATYPGPASC